VRTDDGGRLAAIRIAVGAVRPVPVLAEGTAAELTGSPTADVDADRAATRIVTEVLGASGGTPEEQYRRELVQALARKALRTALSSPRS
jgi:CO/xanthine dehydrogenase FAD-binding subunit